MFFVRTLILISLTRLALSAEPKPFNCSTHNAQKQYDSLEEGNNCLSLLEKEPDAFEICKTKICYLFMQEEPFIKLNTSQYSEGLEAEMLQKPFKCGSEYRKKNHPSLHGIAFDVIDNTSARDQYCAWIGPTSQCTFNALVDFTEIKADEGYMFAITGILLETERRRCHHTPSAPLIDNPMIIVGTNIQEAEGTGPFHQLTRPFEWETWAILGATLLLFAFVAFGIALRFHVFRGRSLVTAFFILFGDSDEALAHENRIQGEKQRSFSSQQVPTSSDASFGSLVSLQRPYLVSYLAPQNERRDSSASALTQQESRSFTTKYGLALTFFRVGLFSFFAIFALFYEVAVVNFLFQQQSLTLARDVRVLSRSELGSYSILRDSALEDIFMNIVDPSGAKNVNQHPPWHQCDTGADCIRETADLSNNVLYTVTFEVTGKYLIDRESNCSRLAIYGTHDVLYAFNGGWLYNDACDDTIRREVDREILFLRTQGKIEEFVDEEVQLNCENQSSSIDPLIILVPVGIFVLPPLLFSVLILVFWKKGFRQAKVTSLQNDQHSKQVPQTAKKYSDFDYVEEERDSVLTEV